MVEKTLNQEHDDAPSLNLAPAKISLPAMRIIEILNEGKKVGDGQFKADITPAGSTSVAGASYTLIDFDGRRTYAQSFSISAFELSSFYANSPKPVVIRRHFQKTVGVGEENRSLIDGMTDQGAPEYASSQLKLAIIENGESPEFALEAQKKLNAAMSDEKYANLSLEQMLELSIKDAAEILGRNGGLLAQGILGRYINRLNSTIIIATSDGTWLKASIAEESNNEQAGNIGAALASKFGVPYAVFSISPFGARKEELDAVLLAWQEDLSALPSIGLEQIYYWAEDLIGKKADAIGDDALLGAAAAASGSARINEIRQTLAVNEQEGRRMLASLQQSLAQNLQKFDASNRESLELLMLHVALGNIGRAVATLSSSELQSISMKASSPLRSFKHETDPISGETSVSATLQITMPDGKFDSQGKALYEKWLLSWIAKNHQGAALGRLNYDEATATYSISITSKLPAGADGGEFRLMAPMRPFSEEGAPALIVNAKRRMEKFEPSAKDEEPKIPEIKHWVKKVERHDLDFSAKIGKGLPVYSKNHQDLLNPNLNLQQAGGVLDPSKYKIDMAQLNTIYSLVNFSGLAVPLQNERQLEEIAKKIGNEGIANAILGAYPAELKHRLYGYGSKVYKSLIESGEQIRIGKVSDKDNLYIAASVPGIGLYGNLPDIDGSAYALYHTNYVGARWANTWFEKRLEKSMARVYSDIRAGVLLSDQSIFGKKLGSDAPFYAQMMQGPFATSQAPYMSIKLMEGMSTGNIMPDTMPLASFDLAAEYVWTPKKNIEVKNTLTFLPLTSALSKGFPTTIYDGKIDVRDLLKTSLIAINAGIGAGFGANEFRMSYLSAHLSMKSEKPYIPDVSFGASMSWPLKGEVDSYWAKIEKEFRLWEGHSLGLSATGAISSFAYGNVARNIQFGLSWSGIIPRENVHYEEAP